jgi:hypothetical protein
MWLADSTICCANDGRNEIVDMGMVAQVTRPGLENAKHPEVAAKMAWVLGQLLECSSRGPKETIIDLALIGSRKRPEFCRYGKRDKKVGDGQQQRLLLGQPGLAGVVLAGRTMPVPTGMVAVTGRVTRGTGEHLPTKLVRPACLQGMKHLALIRTDWRWRVGPIGRTIALDNGIERDHMSCSNKRWLVVQASASACWLTWVYRAVVTGERWPNQS